MPVTSSRKSRQMETLEMETLDKVPGVVQEPMAAWTCRCRSKALTTPFFARAQLA